MLAVVASSWQVAWRSSACRWESRGVGRTVAAQRHFEVQAAGEARPAFAELVAVGLADRAAAFQPADVGLDDRVQHGQDFVGRHVAADAGRADLLDPLLDLRTGLQGRDQATVQGPWARARGWASGREPSPRNRRAPGPGR